MMFNFLWESAGGGSYLHGLSWDGLMEIGLEDRNFLIGLILERRDAEEAAMHKV